MDKILYLNELIDIYGSLLTPKNLKIMKLYYNENYSMQEIADMLKTSRSYVGTAIKKSSDKLEELESNLSIYKKNTKIRELSNINDLNKIKEELIKLLD